MKYQQPKELKTEELLQHLLTTDGRGKDYKYNCLREFIRREWWKIWKLWKN